MKPWWRVLVVLAFVLPVGGYVVGSLAATSVDDPAPRAPMQIAPAAEDDAGETGSPTPAPSSAPAPGPTTGPDPTTAPTDEPIPVRPHVGDDQGGPPAGGGDDDDVGDDDDDDDDDDDAGDGDDD